MDRKLWYLLAVFGVIVLMLCIRWTKNGQKKKMPLSPAIFAGILTAVILYGISPLRVGALAVHTLFNWKETLSLCLVTYLITFLQRMMEKRRHLHQAQMATSAIFNSRRINAMVIPAVVGMLPSPAAAFIAGDIVKDAVGDSLSTEETAFVTSYYRHLSESCLPTYSYIILALTLSGVSVSHYLLGMAIPVCMLMLLGYLFYVRRIPKETGLPKEEHPGRRWLELLQALWAIALVILLILIFNLPVWLATGIAVVLYAVVNRFRPGELKPFFRSAFEWNIMLNTVIVMFFKNILAESGVIELIPAALQQLPLPLPMVFFLLFLLTPLVAGSVGTVAMCMPLAFAAIPDGGTALVILLMSGGYIAMQVSPVHICLTLIAEYFHVSLGSLVRKTLPVLGCFVVFMAVYYLLLRLIPNF